MTNIKNNAYLFVEAGKIHLDAVTKIYQVDLELYYFDGALKSNETKFISSKKVFQQNNQNPDTPKLSLFYNLTHFSMFYSTETLNNHRQILRTPVTHLNNIVFFENNVRCNQCSKENNKKVFFKKQNITGCLECIRNKTDVILYERAMALVGDNYMSRECIFI